MRQLERARGRAAGARLLASCFPLFRAFVMNRSTHLNDRVKLRITEYIERNGNMVKKALLIRLEAKQGKEKDVESFLLSGLPIVQDEPGTTAWFGIRLGPSTFGIFDAFPDESGRQAHLSGRVAAALSAKAAELFAEPPTIERVDVLAAKLPDHQGAMAGR